MPFLAPFLGWILIAMFASWLVKGVSRLVSWREGHTYYVLTEVADTLNGLEQADFPRDVPTLVASLKNSVIEWDICGLSEQGIRDAWGNSIKCEFAESSMVWSFTSAGKDGELATSDDFLVASRQRSTGEAPARAPSPY